MYNSHGVLSYKIKNNQIFFLLSQRRDSLNFIKVLRNLHRFQKEDWVTMLEKITTDELERIKSHDFDAVWEDLHIVKTNKVYITERHRARQNYKEMKLLIEDYDQIEGGGTKEWGIPKGRRRRAETGYDCALREWEEETQLSKDILRIVDTRPFYYNLRYGYKAVCVECWLAEITNDPNIQKQMTKIRPYVSSEVGDLKWSTIEEAEILLPKSIYEMLIDVNRFVQYHLL
jgi:8-oxo-dGTP pyrophosphatase MutT (NUDIX family)